MFIGDDVPIFLMSVFAKNQKANVARGEKAALIEFGKALARDYGAAK